MLVGKVESHTSMQKGKRCKKGNKTPLWITLGCLDTCKLFSLPCITVEFSWGVFIWAQMGHVAMHFLLLQRSACYFSLPLWIPFSYITFLSFSLWWSLHYSSVLLAVNCLLFSDIFYPLWSPVLSSLLYEEKKVTFLVFSSLCVPHQNSSWPSARLSWHLYWVSELWFKTEIYYYSSLRSLRSEI